MKYRKKPVVIEAVQFKRRLDESPDWYLDAVSKNKIITHNQGKFNNPNEECYAEIFTLEGTMKANENDYIIKGISGEFYPCKPDIFEMTYEKVNENPSPCMNCGQDTASCCGCDRYFKWKNTIE